MVRSSRKKLRALHRLFHKVVPAMIVGLLAVIYRTAQEIGYLPKDVVLFPALVLLTWLLFLYFIFAGSRANRFYRRVYNSWGKRRRLMTYLIVISIGATIGGGTAGALWKLFESNRQRIQKSQAAEGQKETTQAQASNTTPTPTPPPSQTPTPTATRSPSPTAQPSASAPKPRRKRPKADDVQRRKEEALRILHSKDQ